MKILVVIIIQTLAVVRFFGQNPTYSYLEHGDYTVGFADTILFDDSLHYKAYGYDGPKPYYIQVWHPVKLNQESGARLQFSELTKFTRKGDLETVLKELEKKEKEILINNVIRTNYATGEPNEFAGMSDGYILDMVNNVSTSAIRYQFPKMSNFPVIVYHHGSQGSSYENFLMAEYFSSRGYIFISTNFHLPYEDTVFGLKPYDQLVAGEDEKSLQRVLRFAKSLSTNYQVYYIGHSWGAQMGFRTLDKDPDIRGMVSLETTIEFKSDDDAVLNYWPEVYHKIRAEKASYYFPIMMCAATGVAEPFWFFKDVQSRGVTFVSTEEQFDHEAYTSLYYLRSFIPEKIPQDDLQIMRESFKTYCYHLEAINKFFGDIANGNVPTVTQSMFIGRD